MSDSILTINAGSSGIKLALFDIDPHSKPKLVFRGNLDEHGSESHLTIRDTKGGILYDQRRQVPHSNDKELLLDALTWIDGYLASYNLVAVGHRVVHGGASFSAPVRLTPSVVEALHELTPMAPLHQLGCLAPIRTIMAGRPELPQIACFDTAFHCGLPASATRFAIPRHFHDSGIRRYGFHGLSFEFIAGRLGEMSPSLAGKRSVVAHLGSGASLCAMRDGTSIDTTMGLTPLDGLMMATRCGTIDPGVLLYLQQVHGLSTTHLENVLYRESGLLGVSGLSGDIRALLASKDAHAVEAVELFAASVARETAIMANSLCGIDCLIFTGGIGEHSSDIRATVCHRLRWLGISLDAGANDAASDRISAPGSMIDVRIIPTNEEVVIARHCLQMRAP